MVFDLKTSAKVPPRLVIHVHEFGSRKSYILADNKDIKFKSQSVKGAATGSDGGLLCLGSGLPNALSDSGFSADVFAQRHYKSLLQRLGIFLVGKKYTEV